MSSYVEIESSGTDARPSSFSGYIHTSPVALARAAREHIRVMGGVPFGFLRDDIEHSWRRSFRAGVGLSTPLMRSMACAAFSPPMTCCATAPSPRSMCWRSISAARCAVVSACRHHLVKLCKNASACRPAT